MNDARVVCRQLGFQDAEAAYTINYFGRGRGYIWLDDVDCAGYESSIVACKHTGVGIHGCYQIEDAGVRCKGSRGENE
jgi:hypothetical protein